jgi:uncharacterized protein YjbJ (UPF0337 family)
VQPSAELSFLQTQQAGARSEIESLSGGPSALILPEPWAQEYVDVLSYPIEESDMDKDRIKGSAEQAKGKVKEWAGKITGDSKTEAEGKADQVKGKVQNTIGGIKDTVRGE